jgi:hypothetical protein
MEAGAVAAEVADEVAGTTEVVAIAGGFMALAPSELTM